MKQKERSFQIKKEHTNIQVSVNRISSENGVEVYRVGIVFPEKEVPTPVTISWEEDMIDHLHIWYPNGGRMMRQSFYPCQSHSRFCFGAPVLSTIGEWEMNRETVAVSDVCTPMIVGFWINDLEQQDKVVYAVRFFSESCSEIKEYSADIRIDGRKLPWYESVLSVYSWWAECGHVIPKCPKEAEDPVYSTWYNFHQAPEAEAVLADLEIAAQLGFKTVILDDGWQFEGPTSGNYSKCGEWEVAKGKFADFKKFVEKVHALDMKLMVWFAVPFIGIESALYESFQGKYLYYSEEGMRCGTLDPRYPKVRAYIKDIYKRFLKEYDIDGFKLDFIDSFRVGDLTGEYNSEMDCETVDEAVLQLLGEIWEELEQIKPGLLYEYRQNYIGPAINRFGNMLRVGDCAYEALTNRIGIVDLRLMGYPTAVHSDMLLWSKKESITLCARQLLNIFFGVPQISVILKDSTEEQRKLLRHYLDYWMENRELIMHGTFRAHHPELNYTRVSVENDKKLITVLYAEPAYIWTGKECDVLHNGDKDGLIFENPANDSLQIQIYNCFGELLETREIGANTIEKLPVPKTGRISVKFLP